MPANARLATPALRTPCGHDADTDFYRTSACMVGFCQRCQRAYDVGPHGATTIRLVLVVAA